ncbi:MAG: molybdopterin molybdotransferase MoeA [Burkholderiaceae bacterium]|jgi:molybdopterin molybdotransferase|nr:molybdopterin molybdotransferase MoeA [Burkholderiaceae bacterium]
MTTPAVHELDVGAAVAQLCDGLTPISGTLELPLAQASGAVLAQDLRSPIDLPAFDNAAMDGYALCHADLAAGATLREVGRSYAGHGHTGTVESGTCVRIMTGAPLPAGADTVVMLEDVETSDGQVRVGAAPPPGANIRRRGEHIARGSVVLAAGTLLSGVEIALAASVGCARLAARRRLRVGVLSTGDELADPPQPLAAAASYDANRPLLSAACTRLGFDVIDLGICADCGRGFSAALGRGFDVGCDALVISGGAAKGDADIVRQAGGVAFVPLNLRPGRGLAHARLRRAAQPMLLLGLPGNVVAAFVMFQLVARPVLLHLAGALARPLPRLRAPLAAPATVRGGRVDYRRARLDAEGRVQLLRDQGSAMLRTLVEADCLVELGPTEHYAAGALVDVIPLGLLD